MAEINSIFMDSEEDEPEEERPELFGSQQQIADAYRRTFGGPTLRTIERWLRDGCPGGEGAYNLLEIERWRGNQELEKRTGDAEKKKIEKSILYSEDRIKKAKARLAEKEEGGVLTLEEADKLSLAKIDALRSRLDALPRLTAKLRGKSEPEQQDILREFGRQLLLSFMGRTDADVGGDS